MNSALSTWSAPYTHKGISYSLKKGSRREVKGKQTYCPGCPSGLISSSLLNVTSLSLHFKTENELSYTVEKKAIFQQIHFLASLHDECLMMMKSTAASIRGRSSLWFGGRSSQLWFSFMCIFMSSHKAWLVLIYHARKNVSVSKWGESLETP